MPTVDGNLNDWTSSARLNPAGTTAAGYSLYGDLSGGVLTFALQAPTGTSIGAYTTIWLNTDKNATTGYSIWGLYGGYDYNINIAADGKPYLYRGGDGQTLVSATPLTAVYNADRTVLEVSVSAAQIGTPKSLNVLADVNNSVFLPGDYGAGPYTVSDASTLPARTYTGHKVGIVYSESTAANYFSPMAYSQLYMAAQNQAAAAGVPYDLLSESDLTDLAKLSNYDTLIFPSFRNVAAAKVAAITDTLTSLEKTYHVGIITAGDFMTNDEKNAPLSGDSYARMKALLDVSRVDGVNGANVEVKAAATTNPVMAGYTAGESIHQYTNISTSYFTSTDGLGTTLANQIVNGQSNIAVMATQTGGKNVHFATDGMLADNNMLAHALDWTMAPATDWLTDTTDAGYTQQMFTDFIAWAAQAGSEFVTLNDLAQRTATLEKSDVSYSFDAASNVLTASATTAAGDLGKFALDVGAGHTIKNVAGWYAYDSNSVFVPKAGGTFKIALDGTPDDVTHLTALADRSDLLSVTGDGSNLSYAVVGEGHDLIQLKSHAGQMVQVTGADGASLSGATLDLTLNGLGQHTVSVVLASAPVGTTVGDWIFGTDGADTINGGGGADTLQGLSGNDTYIVDNTGDRIFEAVNAEIDPVQSSVTYTLPTDVENLLPTGTGAINGTGNALANVLTGNAAANILLGGAGADTMQGLGGDDTYVVDNTGDVVVEAANAGTDTIQSSVSYTLSANVENLLLIGTAAINGTANAQANVLTGNAGANTLSGGDGADILEGKGGNDVLTGGLGADVFIFNKAGQGFDTIRDFMRLRAIGCNCTLRITLSRSGSSRPIGSRQVPLASPRRRMQSSSSTRAHTF